MIPLLYKWVLKFFLGGCNICWGTNVVGAENRPLRFACDPGDRRHNSQREHDLRRGRHPTDRSNIRWRVHLGSPHAVKEFKEKISIMNFLSEDVLVSVTNYDFSDNADKLKAEFARNFPTILIDSQSPMRPKSVDIAIDNEYYPGLWNASVKHAIDNKFKWLMFVASDVEIKEVDLLCRRAFQAVQQPKIYLWTPSLRADSRTSFPALYNRGTGGVRVCALIEGFFFLSRIAVLERLYPIDKRNTYGWGVDVACSFVTFTNGLPAVVDDCVEIYHPASLVKHKIDTAKANYEWNQYLGPNIAQWSMVVRDKY